MNFIFGSNNEFLSTKCQLQTLLSSFPDFPTIQIWITYRTSIVGNLITSDGIVKLYESVVIFLFFLRGLNYRVCPTIGAIDVLISQIPPLPHYSLIMGGGGGGEGGGWALH